MSATCPIPARWSVRDTPAETGRSWSFRRRPTGPAKTRLPASTECSHGPIDLAPGAEISFQVTFRVPTWWSRPVFENCVELTTPGAGEDARTYNNNACGYARDG